MFCKLPTTIKFVACFLGWPYKNSSKFRSSCTSRWRTMGAKSLRCCRIEIGIKGTFLHVLLIVVYLVQLTLKFALVFQLDVCVYKIVTYFCKFIFIIINKFCKFLIYLLQSFCKYFSFLSLD